MGLFENLRAKNKKVRHTVKEWKELLGIELYDERKYLELSDDVRLDEDMLLRILDDGGIMRISRSQENI